jgi:hypothetical protein
VFQECVRLAQRAIQVIQRAPLLRIYITQSQLQLLLNRAQLGASTATNQVEFNMKFHSQSNYQLLQALEAIIFQLFQQV